MQEARGKVLVRDQAVDRPVEVLELPACTVEKLIERNGGVRHEAVVVEQAVEPIAVAGRDAPRWC